MKIIDNINTYFFKRHKLLFSKLIDKHQLNYNIIDIGARGDIEKPWLQMNPERLHCIGFEPDPEEAKALSKNTRIGLTSPMRFGIKKKQKNYILM